MADAKKCDRCGVLYEIYNRISKPVEPDTWNGMTLVRLDSYGNKNVKYFELCPTCMQMQLIFLTGKQIG